MMRSTLATLALATGALFSVPADDARWTVTPRYMRALEDVHGVGCLAGSSGLVMRAGLRAELLFNGTELRLTGIAPPRDTQILMDGEPFSLRGTPFTPGAPACVPFAEWQTLDERVHNLTIVAPPSGRFQFLIANATGVALDTDTPASSSASNTPPSSSPSADPHPLPDSSQAQSQPQSAADSSTSPSPAPTRTPHAGLLIAAVLAPLALFLAAGFGLYYYRTKKGHAQPNTDGAAAVKRSRSFKGMHETQFVMVPETVRPDTPGVVKV